MSIKRSKGFESLPQQMDDALPMSRQQEQHHLQRYWYGHDSSIEGSWTQDDEERVLHSWASRTFSATCYKFTIQSDPKTRQQTAGPLYSFLENWQLHTMYNKSQKILLGMPNRRPCVLLTGDDFMFTPPPLEDNSSVNKNAIHQQARMDYLEEDDDDDDDDEYGGGRTSGGIDEHLWMLYQPTISPLHVVNVSSTDEQEGDDLQTGEQDTAMVMGREDDRTSDPSTQRQQLVSPTLVKWYQTVEHPTIIQQQRRPSTIMTTSVHNNDDNQHPFSNQADTPTPGWIAGQENDDNTLSSSTITTATDTINNTSTTTATTAPKVVVVLTWRQWLQQGAIFLSQRLMEVAYLVAELAESLATDTKEEGSTSHLLVAHTCQDDWLKTTTAASAGDAPTKVTGGHYIVQLFRVWRVFFLGVETMMHRLFSLDPSSPSITAFPLLTKPSSIF